MLSFFLFPALVAMSCLYAVVMSLYNKRGSAQLRDKLLFIGFVAALVAFIGNLFYSLRWYGQTVSIAPQYQWIDTFVKPIFDIEVILLPVLLLFLLLATRGNLEPRKLKIIAIISMVIAIDMLLAFTLIQGALRS